MEPNPQLSVPVDKTKIALPRILSLWDVVMIVIGGVIGSGIFLTPSEIAADVPAPLLMLAVWVVGGLLSFFTSGVIATKRGRMLWEKATASVAMAPESMTRNRVQPKRKEISGP